MSPVDPPPYSKDIRFKKNLSNRGATTSTNDYNLHNGENDDVNDEDNDEENDDDDDEKSVSLLFAKIRFF